MLGPVHIFRRQMEEIRHRRKLLAFLVLLPVLLMVLVGVAFGDRKVPTTLPDPDLSTIQDLKNDTALMTVIHILRQEGNGNNGQGEFRILAASADSPNNPGSKVLVYVIPAPAETDVVIVDNASGYYYYLGFANDLSSLRTARGPTPVPVPSGFETLPQTDIQSLYSSDTALKLARAGVTIFQLGLQLAPIQERRLLDVIFPEIVGIQMAWVGVLGAAVTSVEDRLAGARKRVLMTPVSRASVIFGNAMTSFSLIGIQLIILFATAIIIFRVSIAGPPLDLIPVIIASSFSVIGIGLIISHFSKTADEAFYLSTAVNLPMGMLGSSLLAFPGGQPDVFVSSFFPMTYANRALSMIMVNGQGLPAVAPSLLYLALFALVLYPIGVFLLSRER